MITILFGAILIGLTLGMLGSGGSVMTVPILLYMVGHEAKQSIGESMAIVGLIAIAASIPYTLQKQIHWRSVWWFGIPGVIGTYGGAALGGISPPVLQLVVFGALLMVAAYIMLRKGPAGSDRDDDENSVPHNPIIWKVILEGIAVGIVTGFVGVGGGFLIIPALVLLANLPMRLAIGTSLIIIAAKSAAGFTKTQIDLVHHGHSVDWQTIIVFAAIGILGSLVGRAINQRMNQKRLKFIFAVFLVFVGLFVIVKETHKVMYPETTAPVSNSPQEVVPLPVSSTDQGSHQ